MRTSFQPRLSVKFRVPNPLFSDSKVSLPLSKISGNFKTGEHSLEVALLVDIPCLKNRNEPAKLMGQAVIPSKTQESLASAAIKLDLKLPVLMEDLQQEMDAQKCFIGLVENLKLQKSQGVPTNLNDTEASRQTHLNYIGYGQAKELQDSFTSKVVVAVIDTGIDYNHDDLKDRMWTGSGGVHGTNLVSSLSNDPMDDDGHGTHVAGILAAKENNNFGVAGLTGDYVELMAVKSLDADGGGSIQSVFDGIQYAIANGADIINLSIEGQGRNDSLEQAIGDAIAANIFVVSAAGNQGEEMTSSNLFMPAYIGPLMGGMMTVSSVDTDTARLSRFSNYSADLSEIAAPGAQNSNASNGGILSTTPNNNFSKIPGTSQATPMVAAAAAMVIGYLKTINVNYTAGSIESFIKSDGSALNFFLEPYVQNGRQLNLGFLATNLEEYFKSAENTQNFTEDSTTGNVCSNTSRQ